MKKIYKFFFIYLTIIYFVSSYFLFPYLTSIINPTNIFYVDNEYIFVVLFSLFIFCLVSLLVQNYFPIKSHVIYKNDYSDKFNLIILAYLLFVSGLCFKILNILNGSYLNFLYSDVNSKFFIYEYFSSMNVLNLLSLLFFIACYYNNKINYNFFYYVIPILYFILYLVFSPGGRINLTILLLFIFIFEIFRFSNLKSFIFKILSIFITFLFLFNLITVKKDASLLNYIGIYVMDLDKKIYFSFPDVNMENKKISDVLFNEKLIFFKCKRNLEEYEDKTKYSKYDICKKSFHDYNIKSEKITTNFKIENKNKTKEITYNNNFQLNIFSNSIYNVTVRLNNYRPLNNLLDLLNNKELKERSIFNEYKIISYGFLNTFSKYLNIKLNYERNLEVDEFNIKSGITNMTYNTGVSPTLIGDIYWIGGYLFLFLYFVKIAIIIYFLNYVFFFNNLFLKTISFFFFIQYASTFEQSFEAHSIIFLKNIAILIFCVILYFVISKFEFNFFKKGNLR